MANTEAIVDVSALALGPLDIALRMLCAMLIGAVIGTEREYTHRPAGMRTHMLVALGACAVMTTSQLIFWQYRVYGATPDPARLSAQVITGMGFLGAGTIMKEGATIKGLTTAASIWATACLGIATGGGYYSVAIIGAVCMLITLIAFEAIQKKLLENHYALYRFTLECEDVVDTLDVIHKLAAEADAVITNIKVDSEDHESYQISFRANFGGRHAIERMQTFFAKLSNDVHTDSVLSDRSRM